MANRKKILTITQKTHQKVANESDQAEAMKETYFYTYCTVK